jgi:hypothetical protein
MTGKPTPTELKRLRGTLRADRVLSPGLRVTIPQGDFPEPPEGLGELGRGIWQRVLTEGSGWVSYRLDTLLLGLVCDQFEERAELRELVLANPDQPRLRIGLRELDKQIVSNLGALGLTPTDRARLGFVEVSKESKLSKLQELMQRAEERRVGLSDPVS